MGFLARLPRPRLVDFLRRYNSKSTQLVFVISVCLIACSWIASGLSKAVVVKGYDLSDYPSVEKFYNMYPDFLDLEALVESANVRRYEESKAQFVQSTFGSLEKERDRAVAAGLCKPKEAAEVIKVNANKELGYNLEAFVPWAYYLHLVGCEYKTVSLPGLDAFFFFSRNHGTESAHGGSIYMWHDLSPRSPFYPLWQANNTHPPPHNGLRPPIGLMWPPYKAFFRGGYKSSIDRHLSPKADEFNALGNRKSGRSLEEEPGFAHPVGWTPFHEPIIKGVDGSTRGFTMPILKQLSQGTLTPPKLAIVAGKHTTEWLLPRPMNTFASSERLIPIFDLLLSAGFSVFYNRPKAIFTDSDSEQDVLRVDDYDTIHSKYADMPVFEVPDFIDFAVETAAKRGYFNPPTTERALTDKAAQADDGTAPPTPVVNVTVPVDNDKYVASMRKLATNLVQMSLYGLTDYFVATQGGGSVLCSLFAEKEFIYHRLGTEQLEYLSLYPTAPRFVYDNWGKHNGAWIYADHNLTHLLHHIWLDLVQTTGRNIPEPPYKIYETEDTMGPDFHLQVQCHGCPHFMFPNLTAGPSL